MINIFTTPEGNKYAFNIPQGAQVDAKGFYVINKAMKDANQHIDFDYLAHDLEYRGLRADNTKEPWNLDDLPLCKDALQRLENLNGENETRFNVGDNILFYTGYNLSLIHI